MKIASTPVDLPFAGQVSKAEVKRRGSVSDFERAHPAVKHATLYRVFKGDYASTTPEVQRVETALGWPLGTFAAIARRDWDALVADGLGDLLRQAQRLDADHSGLVNRDQVS